MNYQIAVRVSCSLSTVFTRMGGSKEAGVGVSSLVGGAAAVIAALTFSSQTAHNDPSPIRGTTPFKCDRYSHLLQKALSDPSMPRATGGSAPTFLPKEAPEVVFKKCDNSKSLQKSSQQSIAKQRFDQAARVRGILRSQRAIHVVVPNIITCGDFLIEQRLPIAKNSETTLSLYHNNPQVFNEVVREMVNLFTRVYIGDLVSGHDSEVSLDRHKRFLFDDYVIRYDNLPLYIESENGKMVGKLGLIDLERMVNKPNVQKALIDLVGMFPHHLDIIIQEANQLGLDVDLPSLQYVAARGQQCLHMQNEKLLAFHDWVKSRDIDDQTPMQLFTISADCKASIVQRMQATLPKGELVTQYLPLVVEDFVGIFLQELQQDLAKRADILSKSNKHSIYFRNAGVEFSLGQSMKSMATFQSLRGVVDFPESDVFFENLLDELVNELVDRKIILDYVDYCHCPKSKVYKALIW